MTLQDTSASLLVLARAFDEPYRQCVERTLEHLRARGAIRFSAHAKAEIARGGVGCWAEWIRSCRPLTLLLAEYDGPEGKEILDYCHERGIGVVYQLDQVPPATSGGGMRDALLARCDVIYTSTPAVAEALRARLPQQRIVLADREDAEQSGGQMSIAVTQLARRTAWQKFTGACWRVPSFVQQVGRKLARRAWGPVQRAGDPAQARTRVLFVSNSFLPTLQLCFTRPLQPLADANEVAWEVLADIQLHRAGRVLSGGRTRWARRRIAAFRPDLVVFCRYSGAHAHLVTEWARSRGVPTIYHLDDDLLNVPRELGPEKHAFHNQPERLAAVRHLLRSADLVYCSTAPLLQRMQEHGIGGRGIAARIHCPGEVLRAAPQGGVFKIGYMGIDHAHDFEVALPALVQVLERNPHVHFELFGPIRKPAVLDRFGDRVTQVGFVRSYDEFLDAFAALGWSVGICPLADTSFNHTKANNKWVEYTAAGIATVATAGMLYDECCAGGCGLLAATEQDWVNAMQSLIDDPSRRLSMVAAAQARLVREYSMQALREQVREIFSDVLARAGRPVPAAAGDRQRPLQVEALHGK